MPDTAAVGLIGLAVMGRNLTLNIERNGFPIAVYNRTYARTAEFLRGPADGTNVKGCASLAELVANLDRPRRLILMVQAGRGVDAVLDEALPLLDRGDIVMDGGNSQYGDTERRAAAVQDAGIHYLGTGISGGESGALYGPSIMPGGTEAAYAAFEPVFNRIAAQVSDGPCVTHVGRRSAGHYVKMVHNGIEYGDMQLIAEAYALLRAAGCGNDELAGIFAEWNRGPLESFLIEITADIFKVRDESGNTHLVDQILDTAGQKGTGRWTSQDALNLGMPIPTIDAAVWSRNISARKPERERAAAAMSKPQSPTIERGAEFVRQVHEALYAAKVCSYAQGMALLRAASAEYDYGLTLAEIARIWKGGCIIRARLLNDIQRAFTRDPELPSLFFDADFATQLNDAESGWREVVARAKRAGVACPAMSASLDYYDAYRTARLPANLIQAQRDYFGAHTYRRVDRAGTFHTRWEEAARSGAGASDPVDS